MLDEKVEKLIEKNEFQVKVKQTSVSSFTVTYPAKNLYEKGDKGLEDLYEIEDCGYVKNKKEKVQVGNSLKRLTILCDVFYTCRHRGISYELVRFFDSADNKKKDFWDICSLTLNDEEKQMESTLRGYVSKFVQKKLQEKKFEEIERGPHRTSFLLLLGFLL